MPRRGAYVSRFEPDRARQLLELRSVLESYAAEMAARNRTDDDLTQAAQWAGGRVVGFAHGLRSRRAQHHPWMP